ncbi:MAG TPA: AarF/ABC1/UbiB kinase family protein [Armatimonadota bacterium]|jgi:ubiquinone biosynthesis protein
MNLPFVTKRELARAWQIFKVIGQYGLAPLAQASGISRLFGVRIWRRMERRFQNIPPPVRLRLALTELGTTFIKLGQVLSARSDLLPQDYLTELSKLQDEVPALPFELMEPVFRAAFGYSPYETFRTFDPVPVAAASIGQVYRADLHDGTQVVVKIQRPGLVAQVNTDLSLMRRVAGIAHRSSWLQRFDLPSLVREFSFIIQDELLYTLEGHNAETLAKEVAGHPKVALPQVYWPYTTRQVLTTHWIDGIKITDIEALTVAGIDRKQLSVDLANSLLEQILLFGMFHGDPHPGNLLVTRDGTLVFLDTGIVGRLDRHNRELLIELAISIFDQDIDAILNHLQQLGLVNDIGNIPALRRDLSRLITKYYFLPRKELRLGELLQRINSLLFEHNIRMAYEFGLMAKTLFLAEGVAQELDPDFDYNEAARPVIEEIRRRYYSAQTFIDDSLREFRGLRRQIVDLPRRMNAVLGHLERGTLRVRLNDETLEQKDAAQQTMVNRVSFALLTVGVLIACALLISAHPTGLVRYMATAGLAIDVAFIITLLLSMLKSGSL